MDITPAIQFLNESSLPDEVKQALIARLEKEGLTPEVEQAITDALSADMDKAIAESGVKIDPNDPALLAAQDKLLGDVAVATKKYVGGMNTLTKKAHELDRKISADVDVVRAQTVLAKIKKT
jgi:hypothetical protein